MIAAELSEKERIRINQLVAFISGFSSISKSRI